MSHPVINWASIDRIKVGAEASICIKVSPELIAATAGVTGDFNPLHVDADAALMLGHSRPVAHGVVLLGVISRLIGMQLPGPGSVWFANEVEFLAPVHPGDEVEIRAKVVRVSAASNVVVLELSGRRLPNTEVLRGTAKVRVPSMIFHRDANMDDSQKVALVSGASRGVGRAIATALAADGIAVAVNYRNDSGGADETVAQIKSAGGQAVAIRGDVARAEGAKEAYEGTMKEFGRIDIIVHNATPPIEGRAYLETTSAQFREFFDTYVVGLHELVLLAAPQMRERKAGRIIALLSSFIAEVPPKFSAYITGKHALEGFCRSLAVELGPSGITVNAVSPSVLIGPTTDDIGIIGREVIARKTPLRRIGHPDDVAKIVVFLAGNDASFISGANVPVSGGILF
ncbi:MAG TPA: SDR family oxidoreductase [Gemmatimonadaceae bacterium]|nr:SDR family oxidoreductase [Gemmatimonadaceae bacterium]